MKKPYITKLQDDNKALKAKLAELVSLVDFVPKSVSVDWNDADADWLQNMLKCDSGEKLILLLNSVQAWMAMHAIQEKDPAKCYRQARQADAFREVLTWFHFFCKTSRVVASEKQSKHLVRSKDDLTEDELELRISEMVKGRRFDSYGSIG